MITIFTRFHHLGDKPHHHDESMHSFYSWQLFHDGDYEYNPMMHGPFQFHGNAFMYYLFGVSNATSRYLAAFFGILTVVLAIFLSPFWGRTGALLATALIVFSPSFMYFDRFTREDAYIAGGTFLMVVFLIRYYRSRIPMDLWLASLGFAIAFCTKESIFLTVAVIGTYLFIRLLPWADVFIAGGLTAFGVLTQLIIPKTESYRLPVFLVLLGCAFLYTVYQLIARWEANIKQKEPESQIWEVICGLGIQRIIPELLGSIAWWLVALIAFENPWYNLNHGTIFSLILLLSYFYFVFRFCWLWLKNVSPALTGAISIFLIVFTLLFTTFFTVGATQPDFLSRIHGLLNNGTERGGVYNGAIGGLKYWWGQHDVHRGDEPPYYYLAQLPANELVSFLFSGVAMLYYGLFRRRTIPLFLSYWYVGSLALFSWAGEKMPWLILHPLLPALLLTAYFVGAIIDSHPTEQIWKCARGAAILIFTVLATYSLHSAILLSFYHEANPVEPLVYVQSGPDVQEVERIVRQISYAETGGPNPNAPAGVTDAEKGMHDGLPLTIEDKCSWPFAWQLKDFSRRNHPATITTADNPIIMTGTESDAQAYPILSQAGYVNRKYKLRIWWVPSWYKKGFPGSEMTPSLFVDWFFGNFLPILPWVFPPKPDMVDWHDLKQWLLYREVWSDLGSYNMRLWIRPDLAAKYGFTGTERADIPSDYPKAMPTPVPTPEKKHSHKSANSAGH
ncbi:MAG TPA: flippase activity-associated protein Agl23 [bacterium]|nr:flippase activity-associated protein Agl23 [bacterium]